MSSPPQSLQISEPSLTKEHTISHKLVLSGKAIWTESDAKFLSKTKTVWRMKKGWWTNKKSNRWLSPWPGNNAWSKMTGSAKQKHQFKSKLIPLATTTCLLRYRIRWMKDTMMSRWWTIWSSSRRFAPYVIASSKRTGSSSKTGWKSRRDLIWWWR